MNPSNIPSHPSGPTQEEVVRTLLNTMPDIIYAKDLASRFVMCNAALAELVGHKSPEDLIGKTDADLFPAELTARYLEDERRIFATGNPLINREEPTVGSNGTQHWDSTTKIPIYNAGGKICGLVGITRDITVQKRASELLEQTNQALQAANEQLKAAQFQLIQFEKAQSLSRLAAGLAHEIKNPLAILEMGVSFLADQITDESGKAVMESMHDAVSRANRVIADVMALADNNKLELKKQDLNDVLRKAVEEFRPTFEKANIRVEFETEQKLSQVLFDQIQITRVVKNLLRNAVQALPKGGTISLKTALQHLSPDDVAHDSGNRSGLRFRAGDAIAIVEVRDTGIGIPEANRSAIFDAFFTTKPTGTAVGLGLTVSRKIMELHEGTLDVCSNDGEGTVATLRFKTS